NLLLDSWLVSASRWRGDSICIWLKSASRSVSSAITTSLRRALFGSRPCECRDVRTFGVVSPRPLPPGRASSVNCDGRDNNGRECWPDPIADTERNEDGERRHDVEEKSWPELIPAGVEVG